MEEVTQELREREQRWRNIEILAGCSITTNAGIHTLELMLRPQVNGRPHSTYAPSIGTSQPNGSFAICGGGDTNLVEVHQLLSSQSALMFLTMGGCTGASSYFGGGSLSSSALVKTPRDSMADVKGSSGITRKRSQLMPRDSGSSLGSESSVTQANIIHHSYTYSTELSEESFDKEHIRRVSSSGSIGNITPLEHNHCKDLNDSSTEETDISLSGSDTTIFIMGGSQLRLNSDHGKKVTSSQVSLSPLHSPSTQPRVSSTGNTQHNPSPKRSPMLKSFSQDTGSNSGSSMKFKEREKISASEPALDSPKTSVRDKNVTISPSEEGNSSDSSLMEDRSPSADSGKKQSKNRFTNGILGSLKFSKNRKLRETQKDSNKDSAKI